MSIIEDSQHCRFSRNLKLMRALKGISSLLWLKSIKSVHLIPKQLSFLILVNGILNDRIIFIKVSWHNWLHILAIILIMHNHPISLLTVGIRKHRIWAFTTKLFTVIFEACVTPALRHESIFLVLIASTMIVAINSSNFWREGFALEQRFTLTIIHSVSLIALITLRSSIVRPAYALTSFFITSLTAMFITVLTFACTN